MKKIYFIHDGNAMYPLIKAMKASYSGMFDIEEQSFESAARKSDIGRAICWHMMGYYPKKLPAALTIHDYRSLSLGRLGWFKDRIKESRNAKPDIRVIQPSIREKLNFSDEVKTFLLDVAVSDEILDFCGGGSEVEKYNFCYIGSMKAERKMEIVIDSFLRHRPKTETLALVGLAEDYLIKRYRNNENVIFTGPMPQRDAFGIVKQSRVAVAYFPEHFPHIYQTPTKLLEYGAIGNRILANSQIMNRVKVDEYEIDVIWRPTKDMFADLPPVAEWHDNKELKVDPMLFKNHMEKSGLLSYLESVRNVSSE